MEMEFWTSSSPSELHLPFGEHLPVTIDGAGNSLDWIRDVGRLDQKSDLDGCFE